MTGEDWGYKPSVFQQVKFEHYSLGKVFNIELDKYDKKDGLLERLKSIEHKSEESLKLIGTKTNEVGKKSVTNFPNNTLKLEVKALFFKIVGIGKDVKYTKISVKRG